ncbi:hypothetical protein QC763_403230 [Podospora pseudopauciseta]|uniref:Uncharacterized protein n=2 Tax=Podospora TaxID=5144 RepID=A0ABR0HD34_9PEZI|nr:hypothetical protein QC763_403230 [Podospora pseudopauciseta]KAK4676926.1 hypothetical protein QC764_403230 [Podospora pseudoanserina]
MSPRSNQSSQFQSTNSSLSNSRFPFSTLLYLIKQQLSFQNENNDARPADHLPRLVGDFALPLPLLGLDPLTSCCSGRDYPCAPLLVPRHVWRLAALPAGMGHAHLQGHTRGVRRVDGGD